MQKLRIPKKSNSFLPILLLLLVVAAFIPFFIAARYAIFHSDDFANIVLSSQVNGESHFIRAVKSAMGCYHAWQGTYTCNLIQPLLNPLRTYSFGMLRGFLIVQLFLSGLGVFFLSHELAKAFLPENNNARVYFFSLIMLPILLYREYESVYLWYVGSTAYQIPTIFLSFGLALMLHGKRKDSMMSSVFASICLFIMAGGVLLIGGFGNMLVLVLMLGDWINTKKLNRKYLACFLSTLVGNLLNVAAPGNYAKSSVGGISSLINAFTGAFNAIFQNTAYIISNTGFLLFVLLAFILGTKINKQLKSSTYITVIVCLVASPFVAAFPAMLGYHVDELSMLPTRSLYVLDIAIYTTLEAIAIILGNLATQRNSLSLSLSQIFSSIVSLLLPQSCFSLM